MRHFSRISRSSVRRITQVVATFIAFVAASVMLGSQPAQASEYWQKISPNANWHCGPTKQLTNAPRGVGGQTCIVATSLGYAQAVAVIANNSGQAVDLGAFITSDQLYYNNNHDCKDSTLNSGFQRGCLGPSIKVGCSKTTITATSHWTINRRTSSVTPASYTHSC